MDHTSSRAAPPGKLQPHALTARGGFSRILWRHGHDSKVAPALGLSDFLTFPRTYGPFTPGWAAIRSSVGWHLGCCQEGHHPKEDPMGIGASLDFSSRLRKTPPVVVPELTAVSGVPLLTSLSPNVQAALAAGATVRRLSRRAVLASEGSSPSHVFIVMSGKVRAVRRSLSGREVTLESFQAGDVLADGVVVPERQLSNDWEASEASEVLAISRDVFAAQLQSVPSLALAVTAQLLARLERSKQLAAGLALADVPGRVVVALRNLAETQGQPDPDGVVVQNRPTQQELANSIGACRETVSRVVSDLARRGLITPRGRALVISRRLLDTRA